MIPLRCGVSGCGRVCEGDGYCRRHREDIAKGDDPARLRMATIAKGDRQCPAIGQWDGANCCALVDGHAGAHENHWGQRAGRWGTREEWLGVKVYAPPGKPEVHLSLLPPGKPEVSLSLLPPGLRRNT